MKAKLIHLSKQWYFFPIVGVVFLILINLTIIGVVKARQQKPSTNETPLVNPTATPMSTPTPMPSIEPDVIFTPLPSTSPKATSKPSPSPTPTATPTPAPVVNPGVRIKSPEHQKDYSDSSVEIEIEVITDKNVEKLEVIINDTVKEVFNNTKTMKKTYTDLGAGAHKLKSKAYLEGGGSLESGTLEFGLGGTSWNATPAPSPSPSATP